MSRSTRKRKRNCRHRWRTTVSYGGFGYAAVCVKCRLPATFLAREAA